MTTPQHAIDSGFGYRTTAAEAVAGIDLGGKLAIVTGGYSGLGLETVTLPPREYAALIQRERDSWGPIVRASGFRSEE